MFIKLSLHRNKKGDLMFIPKFNFNRMSIKYNFFLEELTEFMNLMQQTEMLKI